MKLSLCRSRMSEGVGLRASGFRLPDAGRPPADAYFFFFLATLIASRRSLPALKRTFFDAGMVIFSFVRGLRPSRAFRWLTEKLPSPGTAQRSPAWHDSLMYPT